MDKNQTLGFFLIGIVFVAYMLYNQPSKEQIEKQKIELTQQKKEKRVLPANISRDSTVIKSDTISAVIQSDSLKNQLAQEKYGVFSAASQGSASDVVIEGKLVKYTFSSHGGMLKSAILKEYKTYQQKPLEMLNPLENNYNIQFFYQRRVLNTKDFYFEVVEQKEKSLVFRLKTTDPSKYIDLTYALDSTSEYMLQMAVSVYGMEDMLRENNGELSFESQLLALSKEKNLENEKNTSTVYFKYSGEDRDYISERDYEKKDLIAKPQWIAFKQQFFSTAIISKQGFSKTNSYIETLEEQTQVGAIKRMKSRVALPFSENASSRFAFDIYLGPNHYETLASFDYGLEQIIDLGWGIFGWVNKYLVIPVFNFFDSFHWSYGIIILMLTLVFKVLLFPVTYKNYISSAKMKVLKPEMDVLNEKFKDKDPLQKQQAMMDLYRKTGVNPLAGCFPLLLQMPILFALFRFFPASIELRQESFLWAEDLSTYDSVMNLPFNIPFYGTHVSLFAILMAISTLFYSMMNMQVNTMSGPQGAQMKIMMYLMPFMMLFFFNSTSSGLSYYYFAANMISIGQQWIIKKFFVDEKSILAKIEANKIKSATQPAKKSSFQKRLEDMAKARGYKGKI